jgi:putative transcriptional regulator
VRRAEKHEDTGTTTVFHEAGEPLSKAGTDWDRVNAMTEEQIHAAALSDPDAQPLPGVDGDWSGLIRLVNVKRLRERLGLTQEEFASTYRIPVGTLRDWEQRRKNPDATARAYLIVIDKDPKAVAALLNAA